MSTTITTTTIHQPPTPFQSIRYIPTSRKTLILSQKIHTILLIAHAQFITPPPIPSTSNLSPPTNHWSIYLLPPPSSSPSPYSPSSSASDPQPFIHIDCQPSHTTPSTVLPGGSKANVIVSLLYDSTETNVRDTVTGTETEIDIPDAVHRVSLPVTRDPLTVGDIVDLLVTEGREKYEFDERGVGCRFWVLGVVELLGREGIVSGGDWDRARDAVERLWPGGGTSVMDRGAYY